MKPGNFGVHGAISCTGGLPLQFVVIAGRDVEVKTIYTKEELVKHCRWCIRELPCTDAEITVHWFMYGKQWNRATTTYKEDMRELLADEWRKV